MFQFEKKDDKMCDLDEKTLDNIIKETIHAMENGKTQIFEIYEAACNEVRNVRKDIEQLKKMAEEIIDKVDAHEKKERLARMKLAQVSSNFHLYNETDIKICYEEARQIQIQVAVLREQEQSMRKKRDEMEIRLKQLMGTVEKAKQLVSQVGVVLGYLSAQMGAVATKMEELNQEKMLGATIIKAQEDERLRISREIHDGPAQMMANVVYRADVCERLLDMDIEKVREELRDLKGQVRNCLTETRKIIFDLRPMGLDDLGLVATIFHFLEKSEERNHLIVDFNVIGEEVRLARHIEIGVFRMIQEGINNIYKHAQVDQAKLVLEFHHEYLSITIEDEGIGFNEDDVDVHEGECYGLIGMKERISLLKGRLTIISKAFEGTKLRILIPLVDKE